MINDDKLSSLERLHKLKTDGIITEADFEKAKNDLLNGPTRQAVAPRPVTVWEGGLPAEQDHIGWMLLPLKRYAEFNGRSTRKEFWMFQLVYVAILVVGVVLAAILPALGAAILVLALLGLIIPQVAVQVRRFHDQDQVGWLTLINLIPYLGSLVVLGFMCVDGTYGDNRFGPDPKER